MFYHYAGGRKSFCEFVLKVLRIKMKSVIFTLKIIVVLVSVICFFALCWGQIVEYIARDTGVSQTLEMVRKITLLSVLFKRTVNYEK